VSIQRTDSFCEGDLGIDRRIWTAFFWLWRGTSGRGALVNMVINPQFHKNWGIS